MAKSITTLPLVFVSVISGIYQWRHPALTETQVFQAFLWWWVIAAVATIALALAPGILFKLRRRDE